LEAVVKQTGIYASSRKGRLSVFWGDQVFLPSASFQYTPTHHIDIMCTLLGETAPTEEEWNAQGLDKYGVIACIEKEGGRLDAAQVEKVSHETATSMLAKLGKIRQVGPSLGSFSVSAAMLKALCAEFKAELTEKTAKLDTDPHFWMPLTLSLEDYVTLMKQKGTEETESKAHHARMTAMKASFDMGDLGLFGAVDVGKSACWWDYGLLKLYSKNSLLLLEKDAQSDLLRSFLGVEAHHVDSTIDAGVTVDEASYVFGSKVKSGSISNSILAQVQAAEINADGAIIVNCAAKKIIAGKGAILYNLIDDSAEGIVAAPGQVMVSVTDEAGTATILKSHMDTDGGKAWKIKLDENEMSFEDVHLKNKDSNIREIQKKRQESYDKVAASL
jgi:stage V sporulation protein SpoVS